MVYSSKLGGKKKKEIIIHYRVVFMCVALEPKNFGEREIKRKEKRN